jgi:hypothetical protein
MGSGSRFDHLLLFWHLILLSTFCTRCIQQRQRVHIT